MLETPEILSCLTSSRLRVAKEGCRKTPLQRYESDACARFPCTSSYCLAAFCTALLVCSHSLLDMGERLDSSIQDSLLVLVLASHSSRHAGIARSLCPGHFVGSRNKPIREVRSHRLIPSNASHLPPRIRRRHSSALVRDYGFFSMSSSDLRETWRIVTLQY